MKKFKSMIMLLILAALLLPNFSFATNQQIKERKDIVQITQEGIVDNKVFNYSDFDGATNIKLDLLNINVPYEANDIEVEYASNATSISATIIDKTTGDVVEKYTEITEEIEEIDVAGNTSKIEPASFSYITLIRTTKVSPATIEVCARLKIYSSGSFRSIEDVIDVWQREGSSGQYVLKNKKQFANDPLPATAITVNASGTVEVTNQTSVGVEFSFDNLLAAGFSISGSKTGTWYARKSYNKNIKFSVYN